MELPREVHPYYVSTQAHPELLSRPTKAHPLFAGLVKAGLERQAGRTDENPELFAAARVSMGTLGILTRVELAVVPLYQLEERVEDVPLLAEHFLTRVAMREGREPKQFDDEAIDLMRTYDWPGNVRELGNICERASVLSCDRMIRTTVIRPWLQKGQQPISANGAGPGDEAVRRLEVVEREQILRTLDYFEGNRQRTADALGIGLRTLGLKLKKWKQSNLVSQGI